jgi:hypothetical protein
MSVFAMPFLSIGLDWCLFKTDFPDIYNTPPKHNGLLNMAFPPNKSICTDVPTEAHTDLKMPKLQRPLLSCNVCYKHSVQTIRGGTCYHIPCAFLCSTIDFILNFPYCHVLVFSTRHEQNKDGNFSCCFICALWLPFCSRLMISKQKLSTKAS